MSLEIRDWILRSSVLARLDRLIELLSSTPDKRKEWSQAERQWLAEMLHPFSSTKPEECRLQPSPSVSSDEGVAILGAITEEKSQGRMDLLAAEKLVASLAQLRSKLRGGLDLEEPEYSQVLQVARMLRGHLLADPPIVPAQDTTSLLARW